MKRFVLAAACLAASVACQRKIPDSELAARVNDQPISKKEFDEAAERNLNRYRNQGHQLQANIEARIRESVLRRMIEDEIIDLESKKQNVTITPGEIDAKFAEQKARFHTEEAFKEYLTRSQTTEAQMKEEMHRNMLRDRLVEKMSGEITVTDEEMQKFYDDNLARFKDREQIKAARILVRLAPTATDADRKKAKAKASQLAKDAKKPGADFEKLARDNSNGPEAAKGGDLGWLYRGRMPPDFDTVAFAMKAGDVSDAVETKSGYEIIRVEEKKEERQRPLSEVADTIKTSLLARKRNDKRREVLRDLKANAKVEQLIKFDVAGTPGSDDVAHLPGAPGMQPMGDNAHHLDQQQGVGMNPAPAQSADAGMPPHQALAMPPTPTPPVPHADNTPTSPPSTTPAQAPAPSTGAASQH